MADAEALKKLHTTLIDAENGYREAVKDADKPELKALFQNMLSDHSRARADIDQMLLAKGEQPDENGSFMSTVHETVISVRSMLMGLDRGSLKAFADGEKNILSSYDAAIAESRGDLPVAAKLGEHKSILARKVAELEALAA